MRGFELEDFPDRKNIGVTLPVALGAEYPHNTTVFIQYPICFPRVKVSMPSLLFDVLRVGKKVPKETFVPLVFFKGTYRNVVISKRTSKENSSRETTITSNYFGVNEYEGEPGKDLIPIPHGIEGYSIEEITKLIYRSPFNIINIESSPHMDRGGWFLMKRKMNPTENFPTIMTWLNKYLSYR